jgi:hypothetical protein
MSMVENFLTGVNRFGHGLTLSSVSLRAARTSVAFFDFVSGARLLAKRGSDWAAALLLHEADWIMFWTALLNWRTGNAAATHTGDDEITPDERTPPRQARCELWGTTARDPEPHRQAVKRELISLRAK